MEDECNVGFPRLDDVGWHGAHQVKAVMNAKLVVRSRLLGLSLHVEHAKRAGRSGPSARPPQADALVRPRAATNVSTAVVHDLTCLLVFSRVWSNAIRASVKMSIVIGPPITGRFETE